MALLENIAGGFVILLIMSLVVIVAAFLGHSISDGDEEERPPSRTRLSVFCALLFLIGAGWSYFAWSEYHSGMSTWYWIAFLAVIAVSHFIESVQYGRQSLTAAR